MQDKHDLPVNRRSFVKSSLAGGALAASMVGCNEAASGGGGGAAGGGSDDFPKVRWRLISSFPEKLDTIYGAGAKMAERVKEITAGRFEIKVEQAGKTIRGTEVLDAVQDGSIQMGHSASYYYQRLNTALVFDTAVPFGLTARQQVAWLEEAGGRELLQKELFDGMNVVALTGGNTGTQMGGWFRNEIKSLDDLKGIPMRIPGLGGSVMAKLGVTALATPGSEIYTSLQTGNISAAEWVGPYDDQRIKLNEVAKFYYFPGWWEPGPSLTFYINKGMWDKLPATYQAVLRAACSEASTGMMSSYDAKNPAAYRALLDSGVQVRAFPEDVIAAAREKTDELFVEMGDKNQSFKTIYDHWKAFKDHSTEWLSTAEYTYARMTFKK